MSPKRRTPADKLDTDWLLLLAAWLIATSASLGSLFFSEIMELPPCSLCWYQRVFMFPLVVVLSTGLLPFDLRVVRYALPLSALGTAVALYHVLLQAGIIPESAAPCTQGVSCSDVDLLVFGFASIPVLSLIGFCVITGLLLALFRRSSR
ncbi:MAG: disulfide bond formation protein B [Acidobacteria bacterium]|nr:disulfide bond formation protein B [Acidobacteriota bacterium]NIM63649.1 disulfide bond formation protein B [Acidobacteriota bacterium]NIO59260.1 disulfide bond formation protein B [Acidobacteriota bacterium]NIQ85215.1 disulfide bond formation protein B [Acidobacteriota bacterium]NIT10970.1 disulfide bond formation protein B [Acidobacteriota bacterium]